MIVLVHIVALVSVVTAACVLDHESISCDSVPNDPIPDNIQIFKLVGQCDLATNRTHYGIRKLILDCTDPLVTSVFDVFPAASLVQFFGCPKILAWQAFTFVPSRNDEKTLDIHECTPLCDCSNKWLNIHDDHNIYKVSHIELPQVIPRRKLNCDFTKCQSQVNLITTVYELNRGDEMNIEVPVPDATLFERKRFFRYFDGISAPFNQTVSNNTVSLTVDTATEYHMGNVVFICWSCVSPELFSFSIRVQCNVSASMKDEHDQKIMIVHGWPLDNLTVALHSLDNGQSEPPQLLSSNNNTYFRNRTIVIHPMEGHSNDYVQQFAVYSAQCSNCVHDLPGGNFSFILCTDLSCYETTTNINHYYEHHKIIQSSDGVTVIPASWPIWSYFIIAIGITSCFMCAVFVRLPKKVQSHLDSVSTRFRRTSRSTEETSLRMEERTSLSSSDYSGLIIPVIHMGNVEMCEKIGQGAFGEVYKGKWNSNEVAVKTISQPDSEIEREATVLVRLDHPNIVRLFGITRDGGKLLLVFEMMNLGDLRSYLKARTPLMSSYTQFPPALEHNELLFIIREIIRGLSYLTAQQIVHRDLAARNCLLSGESDVRFCMASQRPPFKVKISDFGMSRRLYAQNEYYRMQLQGSVLPVRWLPPESLNSGKFSFQSDIWALGVTIWEIFSFGDMPFSDLSNNELISFALAGIRPPKPKRCPKDVYDLMLRCWELDPEERITAEEALHHYSLHPEPPKPKASVEKESLISSAVVQNVIC